MQLLLGLFFFSILLTPGSSIQCEICIAVNGHCSGVKQECPYGTHVCMSVGLKTKDNTGRAIVKSCSPKDECKRYKDGIGKELISVIPNVPPGTVLTEVTCSKAPPSFASFFPAFLGLLLMKLLF